MSAIKMNGELVESLVKLVSDSTEAQTRLLENQRTIATELSTVSQNGAAMASTLERVVERLDTMEVQRPVAVSDIKAHITNSSAAVTSAVTTAMLKAGPSRMVGWLIAGAAAIGSAGIAGLVLLKVSGR